MLICACIWDNGRERFLDNSASSLQCGFSSRLKVYWLQQTQAVLFLLSYWLMPLFSLPSSKYSHDTQFSYLWPLSSSYPSLIILIYSESPFASPPSPLLSFSLLQPFLCFLPSSAQWRIHLFMMRARGLSPSTITRLYCNPIKLQENGLGMIYSAVYVQSSLLCISPWLLCVHMCFCMCGQVKLLLLMLKRWQNKEKEWALGRRRLSKKKREPLNRLLLSSAPCLPPLSPPIILVSL